MFTIIVIVIIIIIIIIIIFTVKPRHSWGPRDRLNLLEIKKFRYI